jgi:CRISPR-associated protein Csd1
MLLQALCDYARSRKLLNDLAFAEKTVRWIIDLDGQGRLIGQGPIDTSPDGKHGKVFSCPRTSKNKNAGGVAEFLADGLAALFGQDADPKKLDKLPEAKRKAREANNAGKRQAFQSLVAGCAREIPSVQACLRFLDGVQDVPPFLRMQDGEWLLTPATGNPVKLGSDNFTFRVAGRLLLEDEAVRSWWRKQYQAEIEETATNAAKGRCIVTGKAAQPILETHTIKIMRVPGGQATGASLVSFDKSAFQSYGFEKSRNCPTSQDAADAYCTALNALIGSDDTSLRVGNTVLCFWAKETHEAGSLMARLLHRPKPQLVAGFLKSPWSGLEKEPPKSDVFYSVALKGCAGRIAVSQWIQEPVDQAARNLQRWFADLRLSAPRRPPSPQGKKSPAKGDARDEFNPLSVFWLSKATVRASKPGSTPEDPRPETVTQLYRAAVGGNAPSLTLLPAILRNLCTQLADKNYRPLFDESRFSLLKLILNRNRKDSDMEIKSTLTADTTDPAYNCGRLLAVLSATQRKAQGYPKGFSGVAERYFSSASISPASVFPMLLQLNRHHLDKIRKMGDGNAYEEVAIRDILSRLRPDGDKPPEFPPHLTLQGQGRFAIGFYQQQAEDEWQKRSRTVMKFLEAVAADKLQPLMQLQASDYDAFRQEIDGIYCSSACQEWRKNKRKAAEQADADQDTEQLALELGDE